MRNDTRKDKNHQTWFLASRNYRERDLTERVALDQELADFDTHALINSIKRQKQVALCTSAVKNENKNLGILIHKRMRSILPNKVASIRSGNRWF